MFLLLLKVARERAATSLVGPIVTAQQIINGSLATCVYHTWSRLDKLREEYPDKVVAILEPVLAVRNPFVSLFLLVLA